MAAKQHKRRKKNAAPGVASLGTVLLIFFFVSLAFFVANIIRRGFRVPSPFRLRD